MTAKTPDEKQTTESRAGIAKTIARYASSNIYQRIMGALNAFIRPKLLSPELYGLWNLLSIITTHVSYLQLGSRSSMRYRVPYLRGEGRDGDIPAITWSVLKGTFALYGLVSAGAIMYSFRPGLAPEVRWGLVAISVLVMLQCAYEYYISLLKSEQNFTSIAASNYVISTALLLSGLVLIPLFGIYGVYLSAIATYGVVLWFLRARTPLGEPRPFDRAIFAGLVGNGLPIMLYEFIMNLIVTADRIVIPILLGVRELGYYAIAGLVFNFLMQIPTASRDVIEPKMMGAMSSTEKDAFLKEYLLRPMVNTFYYMPFVLGPIFFLFPVLLPVLLPRYLPGSVPTQIIALGAYLYATAFMARGIIVANNWQLKVVPFLAGGLALNVMLNVLLIKAGYGLVGVAAGSTFSYFLLLGLVMDFVRRGYGITPGKWLSLFTPMALPLPAMVLVLAVLKLAGATAQYNIYAEALAELACYTAAMAVLVRWAARRYDVLDKLRPKDFF